MVKSRMRGLIEALADAYDTGPKATLGVRALNNIETMAAILDGLSESSLYANLSWEEIQALYSFRLTLHRSMSMREDAAAKHVCAEWLNVRDIMRRIGLWDQTESLMVSLKAMIPELEDEYVYGDVR